jgi:hypothetical protein
MLRLNTGISALTVGICKSEINQKT